MMFRVHREVKYPDNTNATFNFLVKNYVASVRKRVVAGANILDAAPHGGHFSELRKAAFKPKKVVVSLTLAEPASRIEVDFGQVTISGLSALKSGHHRHWISPGQ